MVSVWAASNWYDYSAWSLYGDESGYSDQGPSTTTTTTARPSTTSTTTTARPEQQNDVAPTTFTTKGEDNAYRPQGPALPDTSTQSAAVRGEHPRQQRSSTTTGEENAYRPQGPALPDTSTQSPPRSSSPSLLHKAPVGVLALMDP